MTLEATNKHWKSFGIACAILMVGGFVTLLIYKAPHINRTPVWYLAFVLILTVALIWTLIGFSNLRDSDSDSRTTWAIITALGLAIAIGSGIAVATLGDKTADDNDEMKSRDGWSQRTSQTPTSKSGTVTVELNSGGVGTSGKWTHLTADGNAEWTFTVTDADKQFVFVRDCNDSNYDHVQPTTASPHKIGKSMCIQNRNSNYDIVVGWAWTLR